MLRVILALLLLAVPLAVPLAGAAVNGPDFVVELREGREPTYEGPEGLLRLVESQEGERYAWNLTLWQDYTVGEFRVRGNLFDVARMQQVVPSLEGIPDTQYPLFHLFPDDELWTADGPAQVYRYRGTPEDFILRLGFIGPANLTLALERDVTPPTFTVGPVRDVTTIGFYQETRTDELAIANLMVRKPGRDWVENPTPSFHVLQRFPVQGLDADTEYEAQIVFTDWAGNEDRTSVYKVRTAPEPVRPQPVVTPLEPAPNATVPDGRVTIRARIEPGEAPMRGGDIRLFLDKREIRENLVYEDETFHYTPPEPLAPGLHSVSIEATNALGGKAISRWTFTVAGGEENRSPAPGALPLLALAGLVALALRLRRRGG